MDILLDGNGDLLIDKNGDIVLDNSVRQKIRIRLLWFLGEWRWNKEYGLPYFDELFVKNPDTDAFEREIRDVLMKIDEVSGVDKVQITGDSKTRIGTISVVVKSDKEIIREEVSINE